VNHGVKFSKENQPSPEAKSEGVKKWWEGKKANEMLINEIAKTLLKKAGVDAEGNPNLINTIANIYLERIENKDMDEIHKIISELSIKQNKTDITSGDKPLGSSEISEKDKAILKKVYKDID